MLLTCKCRGTSSPEIACIDESSKCSQDYGQDGQDKSIHVESSGGLGGPGEGDVEECLGTVVHI